MGRARHRSGRRGDGALILGVVLAAVTGCGEDSPRAAGSTSPSTSASSSPAGDATASASTPPVSSSPPSETKERVRVIGRVLGVQAGCTALRSDQGVLWQLIGPAATGLERGDRVSVTGAPRPGARGCPEGAVVAVQRVTALD